MRAIGEAEEHLGVAAGGSSRLGGSRDWGSEDALKLERVSGPPLCLLVTPNSELWGEKAASHPLETRKKTERARGEWEREE